MADSHPPQPTNGPAAKSRSPVERILVWGLIGALLVAVGVEYMSRTSHGNALKTLQDKIKNVDKDATQPEVTERDVKAVVGNKKPDRTEEFGGSKPAPNGAKRLEVYSWFSLNPTSKRELWVWYGVKGQGANELANVIEVQSSQDIAELPKPDMASDAGAGANPMAGGPPDMTGMRGGPPGSMMSPPGMGGPGMRGGRGGARGRPAAGDTADADKADTDKADAESAADSADEKKTADDESNTDKAGEEKTTDEESDKTDTNSE